MNPTNPKKKVTIIMRFIVLIAFLASIFFAVYFYRQYQTVTNEQARNQKEIEDVKNSISKLLIVPEEDPVIATVTDKTKLEQQAFFRQAENGDKVVIYQTSGKAVLFRPSVNKIVDITVINITPENTTQTQSQQKTLTINNGTTTTGLAAQIQEQVLKEVQDISVTNIGSATNTNYEKTIVVVNNESARQKADEIAKLLGAEIQTLPQGETSTNTDLLIIIGSDKNN